MFWKLFSFEYYFLQYKLRLAYTAPANAVHFLVGNDGKDFLTFIMRVRVLFK